MTGKEKILVIDDDPLVLRTLSRILTIQGFHTTTAHNSEKALECASRENYDVVLSDIRMPRTNGVTTVKKIEEIYRGRNRPCGFIFLTGFAEETERHEAVQMVGVADFMMKPFDSDKLISAIEYELEMMRRRTPSQPQADLNARN